MDGESVWVCSGEDCVKCGEFQGIGNGQWGTMQCGGEQGIQGHYIKISVPAANLQIAQVEVFGAGTIYIHHIVFFSKNTPTIPQKLNFNLLNYY